MSDEPTTRPDDSLSPNSGTPGLKGLDESIIAAADEVVEREYLSTPRQQSAIARARERALSMVGTYREDPWFRAEASVKLSANINFFYCVYQVVQAIRYERVWFIALAMYGAMVAATRFTIIRYLRPDAEDGREELERYRNCGYLMVMLAFAVSFLAMLVNYAGEHPVYPGSMIWVIGAYTIYMVYASISNLIVYRKLESPLISASKQVSMACAMTSLYSLQAAALALYAVGDYLWLRNRLNTISAVIICLIIFFFAFHIINRASRALAGKEDLSFVVQAKVKEVNDDNRAEWKAIHEAEALRQLEYWRGKEGKVEWHTQAGAWERANEQTQRMFRDREKRRSARRKK